jgi:hypothetical protein
MRMYIKNKLDLQMDEKTHFMVVGLVLPKYNASPIGAPQTLHFRGTTFPRDN